MPRDWNKVCSETGMRAAAYLFSIWVLLSCPMVGQQTAVPDAPEVYSPFTLTAAYDGQARHNALAFAGRTVPPTIRVFPGSVINLRYVNALPVYSNEECALARCADRTNLHFHGLHVSPQHPQDDVLTMMAMPGQALQYRVEIPSYAAPGLYWYHTHPHGESARQSLDGMSGAIVIEGIDRYYPELRGLRERVLVLRDQDIESTNDETRARILQRVGVSSVSCGTQAEQRPRRVFTLNGEIRPQILINSGEPQFWRVVNASPDRYADLQLEGQQLEIVALDGMPLNYHAPGRRTRKVDHLLLPPAGRIEVIVTAPEAGKQTRLRTRCVDTGPDGDDRPAMVIADVLSGRHKDSSFHKVPTTAGKPFYKPISNRQLKTLKASPPDFIVTFTEDKDGFYINGKKFTMDAAPMVTARVGSLQHWRVVNATRELHPFHIHQVHFLAYAVNETPLASPEWLDTTNIPYGGTADLIMDFTDPIIRGISVFHCHLLSHEDKGMMAKILFE